MSATLSYAEVSWDAEGRPYSPAFGDIYFAGQDGLAESRAVFLHANHLPARWTDWPHEVFSVGELGFGSGLNFVATWQAWRTAQMRCARLVFVSVEKYPLPPPALSRILGTWPELAEFATQLRAHYPFPRAGWHQLEFTADAVTLMLWLGDVTEMFAHWPQNDVSIADAWYLDGFAPAKNPAMWEADVIEQLARHSRAGTTFGTFSAAGRVRRDLQQHGFVVEKRPGFGYKRERLQGVLVGLPAHYLKEWETAGLQVRQQR